VAEVFPGHKTARYMLGTALLLDGDLERADREFVSALAASATYAQAWSQLGTVRLRRGMVGSAEECYRRALSLQPENAESLYSLAEILESTGRTAEARPLYAHFARVATMKYEAERRRALQLAQER
jgi:Tfp pilus assembly protein PilF